MTKTIFSRKQHEEEEKSRVSMGLANDSICSCIQNWMESSG